MALLFSSIAQVCRGFGLQVSAAINAPNQSAVRVLIGTPSVAAPGEGDSDHRLNLFFFRFETSGFDGGILPGDPWLLRMHCLATPFCCDEPPTPAGENDLRIMGELLRHIHENPVSEMTVDGSTFMIQTIFLNLGLDQVNQLWSTQGDTVYRPSVLFELSLAPVLPRKATIPGPLVTGLGVNVRAVRLRPGEGLEGIEALTPVVRPMRPDTASEDWAPALALVNGADGAVLQAVSLQLGSTALADFAPRAWLAGEIGSSVALRWESWEKTTGWQAHGPDDTVAIGSPAIDPEQAPNPADLPATALPFTNRPGQTMLYAVRSYIRAADGAHVSVRSNPVLVNLFKGAP
ncbi:MAG: DUF4255 domain-containing protein [Zoogloea sp.]|nr:DUF4255 domain-containing protein [Zoogloea sp.]